MKVFIINLKRDLQKKHEIISECSRLNINHEIIEAVSGIDLSAAEVDRLIDKDAQIYLTKGEIGCSLSHLRIYQKIISEALPYALILEDDAILHDDLNEVIQAIENVIDKESSHAYLLYKTGCVYGNKRIKLSEKYSLYESNVPTCTHGYVVTNKTARLLTAINTPVRFEADAWRNFYFEKNIRPYSLNINLIDSRDQSKENSTIEEERLSRTPIQITLRESLDRKNSLVKFYHKICRRPFLKKMKQNNNII
ncbi:glycosyltransferase family 25 protein [Edwardsiella piscicida]|uniref:glycosyltransferase family 25 protein n=1 Tax=Edwardsiella piscicida TaxID=1263550 RepID=UPI0002C107D6|nr:glycosyltransferase family 25 protein [Edwardsiella piscicida]AGH74267.1 Beta-1,4-galactosyltransferase [Edwardsiella piscicida C07-087]EKS7780817.1 glycosyltransferase family 25 protein [Edwardsiella piscicida]EKS7784828.1 glycosyltransferase family 25 protein [Edwardsiella piscicida]UCQ23305.1 glycosyltransferase family 25 protein [Edwardsiella piscicida]UCQ33511.1 glycosyltransferase family 25 protein [Edwardsiella piscicida]